MADGSGHAHVGPRAARAMAANGVRAKLPLRAVVGTLQGRVRDERHQLWQMPQDALLEFRHVHVRGWRFVRRQRLQVALDRPRVALRRLGTLLGRDGFERLLRALVAAPERTAQHRRVSDTSPAAARFYHEHLRALSPRERLLIAARLSMAVRKLAEAGIRRRYPEASARDISTHLAIRMYGRRVVERVLGELPADVP